jgi:hypothetical protein
MKIKSAIASLASLVVALSPKAVNAYPAPTGNWQQFATSTEGVQLHVDVGSVQPSGNGFVYWQTLIKPDNSKALSYVYIDCPARQDRTLYMATFNGNGQPTGHSTNFPTQVILVNSVISTVWDNYCRH